MGKKKSIFNKILGNEPETTGVEDEFYAISREDKLDEEAENGSKMILVEPRAFSESKEIADHLKYRNSVVVNLKRVTSDQAKRIIDFLSGCVYSIGGSMQKVGVGIYLCAPNNVRVDGEITEDNNKNNNDDDEM